MLAAVHWGRLDAVHLTGVGLMLSKFERVLTEAAQQHFWPKWQKGLSSEMSEKGPSTRVVTVLNSGSNSSEILDLYSTEKPPNPWVWGTGATGRKPEEHMPLYQHVQHCQPAPSL